MSDPAVVIAGGGPTGLMLAGELALADVDVVIVERRANQDVQGTRANCLHARTLEILDQRGVAGRFVSAGRQRPAVGFAGWSLDMSDLSSRHNYLLGLFQHDVERLLADWVIGELGVPILRRREVVGFAQDGSGIDVDLTGGRSLRTQYLVGCDGGRSLVRKAAGIDFLGWDPTSSQLIAEVEMASEPEIGALPEGGGIDPVDRAISGGPYRVVLVERHVDQSREPTMSDLRKALVAAYGTDYGVHSLIWISRFTDTCRQAAAYRERRVLLAGDAAHVHGPQGGQGLNIGVQDAVNLGWKLAQVVNGISPEHLLDTYHAERHPVAARVLQNTMAQVALGRNDERSRALRDTMADLLAFDHPRRFLAAMMSGLDVHYDLGPGHALLGRRIPDLELATADGPTSVFALLNDARPVLLNFGNGRAFDVFPSESRIRLVDAKRTGPWEIPLLGQIAPPQALAIRPDGHVAWTGDLTHPDLPGTLTTWFGQTSTTHR